MHYTYTRYTFVLYTNCIIYGQHNSFVRIIFIYSNAFTLYMYNARAIFQFFFLSFTLPMRLPMAANSKIEYRLLKKKKTLESQRKYFTTGAFTLTARFSSIIREFTFVQPLINSLTTKKKLSNMKLRTHYHIYIFFLQNCESTRTSRFANVFLTPYRSTLRKKFRVSFSSPFSHTHSRT